MRHDNFNHIRSDEIILNNFTSSKAEPNRQNPRPSVFYDINSASEGSSEDNEEKTNDLIPPKSPRSPHSNSFRSRPSSFSRFFESLNNIRQGHFRRPSKNEFHDNEEKRFLYSHNDDRYSHRGYFFAFVVGFVILFSIFSLILWIVSCHQKPTVVLESITFDKFYVQGYGVDARGFLTSTLSLNSSVKLNFRNTGTFFKVHVTSIPLNLNYYQLPLATGNIPKFDQSKKSKRSIEGMVKGNQVPLYGAGPNFENESVPLILSVAVRSKAYVLGWLVTNKFYNKMECSFVMESKKIRVPIPLANKCK